MSKKSQTRIDSHTKIFIVVKYFFSEFFFILAKIDQYIYYISKGTPRPHYLYIVNVNIVHDACIYKCIV